MKMWRRKNIGSEAYPMYAYEMQGQYEWRITKEEDGTWAIRRLQLGRYAILEEGITTLRIAKMVAEDCDKEYYP